MIAAQYQRKASALNGGGNCATYAPSHRDDTVNIFQFGVSDLTHLLNGHFNIALIFNGMTHLLKFILQVGIANGTGAHIHAAAPGTQIDRHTNKVNLHKLLLKFYTNG